MSKFEVIRGVEGCCLALDNTRIAGPKPWGGGTVIHEWETSKEYKAVDKQSRWYELFGTPERAARMLERSCHLMYGLKVDGFVSCIGCPVYDEDADVDDCCYDALLEWLRGDA